MPTKDETWKTYTRGVVRVRARKKTPPSSKEKLSDIKETIAGRRQSETPTPLPAPGGGKSRDFTASLERRREKALRQGTLEIDSKLDLHGMTQAQAFEALARFIRRNVRAQKRNLLIITGKGSSGGGVLRQNLRPWLCALPEAPQILALRPAAPKHGGEGAHYVILKRNESTREKAINTPRQSRGLDGEPLQAVLKDSQFRKRRHPRAGGDPV